MYCFNIRVLSWGLERGVVENNFEIETLEMLIGIVAFLKHNSILSLAQPAIFQC